MDRIRHSASMVAKFLFLGFLFFTDCEKQETGPEIESLEDIDGNTYNAVKIFTGTWMTENLKTSKLNDGVSIELVPDAWNWDFLNKPKRCYYDNDGSANRDVYGHLYNFYAVSSKHLCPVGWHIPTRMEWQTLIGYFGGYTVAGGKLKESGTTHWSSPNSGADNGSNFSALPGGYRNEDGIYKEIGASGVFWCSDRSVVKLTYNSVSALFEYINNPYHGASVRCVKDN